MWILRSKIIRAKNSELVLASESGQFTEYYTHIYNIFGDFIYSLHPKKLGAMTQKLNKNGVKKFEYI